MWLATSHQKILRGIVLKVSLCCGRFFFIETLRRGLKFRVFSGSSLGLTVLRTPLPPSAASPTQIRGKGESQGSTQKNNSFISKLFLRGKVP